MHTAYFCGSKGGVGYFWSHLPFEVNGYILLAWIPYPPDTTLWIPNPLPPRRDKGPKIPYCSCSQKGHGTRDQEGTYPSPGQTNTYENIAFPQLRWRAEIKGQTDCGANFRLSESFHFSINVLDFSVIASTFRVCFMSESPKVRGKQ